MPPSVNAVETKSPLYTAQPINRFPPQLSPMISMHNTSSQGFMRPFTSLRISNKGAVVHSTVALLLFLTLNGLVTLALIEPEAPAAASNSVQQLNSYCLSDRQVRFLRVGRMGIWCRIAWNGWKSVFNDWISRKTVKKGEAFEEVWKWNDLAEACSKTAILTKVLSYEVSEEVLFGVCTRVLQASKTNSRRRRSIVLQESPGLGLFLG